jgi:tRNA G18 (ribose-2'-O)-methylase SpoU
MEAKRITSPNNPTVKILITLARARGIKKHGIALLSGPKQIREVLKEFPDRVQGFVFTEGQKPSAEAAREEIPLYHVVPELFHKIDPFDMGQPMLMVRVDPFPLWSIDKWPPGCTLCIPFQDPVNVGAVIRSAAAFGVSRIVVLKEAAHPFLPKSARAAGSALFRIPICEGPSLEGLNVSSVPMITLSPGGEDIEGYSFPETFCLVPGLEGPGLPKNLRRHRILSIPMEPSVDSLNAALATGIALYKWYCRSAQS